MKEKIEHEGVVFSVEGEHVRVKIVQQAACNGCKARSMCTSSESKEKFIDVYERNAALRRKVGDKVRVCGALRMGKQAVRLAFGVPLAVITVWMPIAIILLHLHDLVAVGVLILILSAYFYVLYLCRDKMAQKFAFWIETN